MFRHGLIGFDSGADLIEIAWKALGIDPLRDRFHGPSGATSPPGTQPDDLDVSVDQCGQHQRKQREACYWWHSSLRNIDRR